MNERIRELKNEAFRWCDENIPYETGYGDAWEDKFAELILSQCVETIKQSASSHLKQNATESEVKEIQLKVEGALAAMSAIVEHFGVEE